MAETWKILVLAGLIETCLGVVGRPATAAEQVTSTPAGLSFELLKERGRLHALAPNARHIYRVNLKAGQLLSATFEQLGLDVHLDLLGPDGELLSAIDSPNANHGQEPVLLVAGRPGIYTIAVTTGDPSSKEAAYLISKAQVRQAAPRDRETADAVQNYYAARFSYKRNRDLQALQTAVPALERTSAPKTLCAFARQELGKLLTDGKKWLESAQSYKKAARLFHQLGMRQEAASVTGAGIAELETFLVDEAVEDLERGLSLARSKGDEQTEASASTHLGVFYAQRADIWNAKPYLERAIAIREKSHDIDGECTALNGMAVLLRNLGEYERALKIYQNELRQLKPSPRVRAIVLTELGILYTLTGRPDGAFRYLQKALKIQERSGDLFSQANTLVGLGFAYTRQGSFRTALASYQRALAIYANQNDVSAQATSLLNIGWALGALGRYTEAADATRRAFSLAEELRQPTLEGGALLGMAWVERLRGNLAAAGQWATEAVQRIESTRNRITDRDSRLAYFSSLQDAYELLIDALMEQYDVHPSQDLLERALQASESARSRSLLDALGERDGAVAKRLAPVLGARYIQRQVLDTDTILLEYSLGSPKSYLLLVTKDGIERFELPARERLESLAIDLHDTLANSQITVERSRALEKKATKLGSILLGPVAGRLRQKRLLIVASGALQLVPFGLLPDPTAQRSDRSANLPWPEPLLKRHDVLLEPSASVLARIREIRASRRPASALLAVIADPVYERDDPRFPKLPGLKRAGSDPAARSLDRLPASAEEAQAITAGLPPAKVFKVLGFAATREILTSGRLKGYQVLHIAAHNFYSEKSPASSGLFLSQYDILGRPRNGVLRIKDISSQDLRSDLVVLSTCDSALGKQVRGEGIVGWPWAFLSAGASEVVMSFWEMGDTSTKDLMKRLYGNMSTGLSPSDALREAQLFLWSKGKAPRVWGGFMAQGEWNLHPLSLNKAPAIVSSHDGDPRSPTMTKESPPANTPR
jgi:CHAT domain-containing protein/Tfp pilus assembly protein PilF